MIQQSIRQIVFTVLLALFFQACASPSANSKAKEEIKEAMGLTQADWKDVKNDYIKKSETRIKDIAKSLSGLDTSIISKSKDVRDKADDKIADTKELLADLQDDLKDLRKAEAGDWHDEQVEFQTALNKLEKSFDEVRAYF